MKFDIEDNRTRKNKEKDKQQRLLVIASLSFAVLSILLIIIYFATQNTTTNTTPKQNTSKDQKEVVPKKEEKEEKEEDTDERPLAVMIDGNTTTHAGLQDSYVNYEMLSDNGNTKILALFKDAEVGVIGPVTTAEHYFLDYAREHNAVITSYGMNAYTEKQINDYDYDYIGKSDSSAFMQDKETSTNNIYTSINRMKDVSEKKKYKLTSDTKVLKYSDEELDLEKKENSKKSSYVNLKYSTNETREYKYDSSNKYYLRFNNGEPDVDRSTEEQLHYKNIIIIYINTDTVPREDILDINTVGSGEGYYVTNGYAIPIKWEKANKKAKTIYRYKNNEVLKINEGNTFIQIVPGTED